jgi:acetyl esterase
MRYIFLLAIGFFALGVFAAEVEPGVPPGREPKEKQASQVGISTSGPEAVAEMPPTPAGYPDAQTFVYRELSPVPIRLHVFKPKDWTKSDRRPALVYFFGGGWVKGSTDHSAGWGRWAASLGLVGVVPDYRTKDRFGTTPLEAVADARAALRWVQDHAAELGIDPARVVVAGNSAGGHLALWTAITRTPPGSFVNEAPKVKPITLILSSPVSDTTEAKGYMPSRFGANAAALSAIDQMDEHMPPTLLFHGDEDQTVPQRQSLALRDKLIATGNECEFINVPGGSHNFSTDLPEWKEKVRNTTKAFLEKQHVLSAK